MEQTVVDRQPVQDDAAIALRRQRLSSVGGAVSWMYAIGALTAVNVGAAFFDISARMVVGLEFTDLFTGLGEAIGPIGKIVGCLFALGVAGAMAGLAWAFKRKGQLWAPIVVLVVYGLDLLLALAIRDYLGVLFHGLAIFYILRGFLAIRALLGDRALAAAPAQTAAPASAAAYADSPLA